MELRRFLLEQIEDVLDNLRINGMGVERNRIRIHFSEEFSFDVRIRGILQQIHKTGIHRKRAMAIRVQYSDLGEFPIQGISYCRAVGAENGCEIIPACKTVALEMVLKKALDLFIC